MILPLFLPTLSDVSALIPTEAHFDVSALIPTEAHFVLDGRW